MVKAKKRLGMPFYLQTIIAMLLGVIVGIIFGPQAAFLGIIAQLVITLIKALATPLLFVTIFESVIDSQFKSKGVGKLITICAINVLLATIIGLTIINLLQPGAYLHDIVAATLESGQKAEISTKVSWAQALQALIPESIVQPFVTNQIPPIIILAILFGICLRRFSSSQKTIEIPCNDDIIKVSSSGIVEKTKVATHIAFQILIQAFHYIIYLIPLAVFAAVAKAVGLQGTAVFKGLLVYVVVCCGGMFLHILIVYQAWIRFYAGRSLIKFWSTVKNAALYAFGVNSSLATLPLTLKTLDELKVSPGSARLSACLGTNFNNDGIFLYQIVAILMVAQALGLDMSIGHQINLTLLSLIATLGVAGIPEAGVIALTIIMTTAKMPLEIIPLLLSVDWIVARVRSVTNVLGDITVAIAIDKK